MTDELKPCPFCGGDAEQDYEQPYRAISGARLGKSCAIYCTTCSTQMMLCHEDLPDVSPEALMADLVAAWNTRADTATPDPAVPTVKSLVWGHHPVGIMAADNVGGSYIIDTRNLPRPCFIKWPHGRAPDIESLEAAKAAAQADYEARILSAITMAPADPLADPRVVALVEALRNEQTYWQTKADADWRDQEAEELVIDYPTPRRMTEAMKRADELRAALAAITATEEAQT